MAEFVEIMKQAGRICRSVSCDNCIFPRNSYDETCIWEDAPRLTDEAIAEIEAKTMKWAAENPEVRYPTWREWSDKQFPDADESMKTCAFISKERANCAAQKTCSDCRNQTIPADIAEKLGIKPKDG